MHKGLKCLDICIGRIYISRDVVFDDNIFPFAELHPNAGARLRDEILLLPTDLFNPASSMLRGTTLHSIDVVNSSINFPENFDSAEGVSHDFLQDLPSSDTAADPSGTCGTAGAS